MADADSIARTAMLEIAIREAARKRRSLMLILDYKLRVNQSQHAAIDEAIRTTQFIRNKCVRKWMDERGIGDNDRQVYSAQLAREYPFAARLN
jgi:putative transposase